MDEIFDATDRVMFKRPSKRRTHELRLEYRGALHRFFITLQYYIAHFVALGKFFSPKTEAEATGGYTNVYALTPNSLHLLLAVTFPTLYGKYPEPITEFNVCHILGFVDRFELYDIGLECIDVVLKTKNLSVQEWFFLFDYISDLRLDDERNVHNKVVPRKVRTHIMRQALINDAHQVANMCILKYASSQHSKKWEQIVLSYDSNLISHEVSQLRLAREGQCACSQETESTTLYSDVVKKPSMNVDKIPDNLSEETSETAMFCSSCLTSICSRCKDEPCGEKISKFLTEQFDADCYRLDCFSAIPCDAWNTKCSLDSSCSSSISGDSGFCSYS